MRQTSFEKTFLCTKECTCSNGTYYEIHSQERQNEVIRVWDFKPACFDILTDMRRHFISSSVYMILYHPKWIFISVKITDTKSIPAMSFKRTYALNVISNKSALLHFPLGKFCSNENLMPVWNFISVKMTDMKSIPFWVSFHLNSCEHKKRADWTPKWDFQPK